MFWESSSRRGCSHGFGATFFVTHRWMPDREHFLAFHRQALDGFYRSYLPRLIERGLLETRQMEAFMRDFRTQK